MICVFRKKSMLSLLRNMGLKDKKDVYLAEIELSPEMQKM